MLKRLQRLVTRKENRRYAMTLPPLLEARRPAHSPEKDPSTLSNYDAFHVDHTALDLHVLFDQRKIKGSVLFKLRAKEQQQKQRPQQIHLDTSHLDIHAVQLNGQSCSFELKPRQEPLGSQLVLEYSATNSPQDSAGADSVKIDFSTTEQCTALQWLSGKQTSGQPYVFSQLEAIHARSLFPCFDTPSIKSAFSAQITSPLPVVFSGRKAAAAADPDEKAVEGKQCRYRFEQPVPIPSYLVGLASGDLVSAAIGPRSSVYTEPFRLAAAQWEFQGDVEKFMQAAEHIVFPYEWGTYDILINVDSYPYGGMESPNMTFATPTLIAHDKSNIDVIAHELAHSWSGNLVTNCSWNHFWLNEGWTVYLERRITGAIHGEPTRHLSALIGWNDLTESIAAMSDPGRFSKLLQDLGSHGDPDEAFSSVPYEKGFNLLFHLEQAVGGKDQFDPFVKHYFKKFARQSLDTFQFLDTLYEFFEDRRDVLDGVDWETWLYKPGLPPKPQFDTSLADDVYAVAERWFVATSRDSGFDEFSPNDLAHVSTTQLVLFLDTLVQAQRVDWSKHTDAAVKLLDVYRERVGASQNAEIVFRKFRLQVEARIEQSYEQLAQWLGTVGRMKFVRPGYRLLNKVDRPLALRTFEKFKDTYHPICKALVKQDLKDPST
ncbi:probable Leukotriene A-4 hydrolase homolog [Zygosaccharomyces bailii]|nr:probable Leukotriene A-4 hydrolase homolog [Zygosaccharomyces bailii]